MDEKTKQGLAVAGFAGLGLLALYGISRMGKADNSDDPSELDVHLVANPPSGTNPTTVTFTLNATGTAKAFEWTIDFGDGSPVNNVYGPTISHQYTTVGSYDAIAVAKTVEGVTATSTVKITITGTALNSFNVTVDKSTGDVPLDVIFTMHTTGNLEQGTPFVSYIEGVRETFSATTKSHKFNYAGTFNAQFEAHFADGTTKQTTVEIKPTSGGGGQSGDKPNAPTDLKVSQNSSNPQQLTLTWTKPTLKTNEPPLLGYRIYEISSGLKSYGSPTASDTSAVITVANFGTLKFVISAQNVNGWSPNSNEAVITISGTTHTGPSAPSITILGTTPGQGLTNIKMRISLPENGLGIGYAYSDVQYYTYITRDGGTQLHGITQPTGKDTDLEFAQYNGSISIYVKAKNPTGYSPSSNVIDLIL